MEPDTTFTRRMCAVLLADVTGFSKLVGENDERTPVPKASTDLMGNSEPDPSNNAMHVVIDVNDKSVYTTTTSTAQFA